MTQSSWEMRIKNILTHTKKKQQKYKDCLKVAHLNTQSMRSPFDEFQVMLQQDPFDIITLSESRYVEAEESVLK